MPEVLIIYISETDIWHAGKTIYSMRKLLDGTDVPYDDGLHMLYVNTAVDDGTEIAALMRYFQTADPEDMSQGDLSKRVHFLKCEEGGLKIMCEVEQRIWQYGHDEGLLAGRQEIIRNLATAGMSSEKIAEMAKISLALVKQWLEEPVLEKQPELP